MSKGRRGGQRLVRWGAQNKLDAQPAPRFLPGRVEPSAVGGLGTSSSNDDVSAGCGERSASICAAPDKRPDVLDALSTAELSETYGKGFELLRRMGFSGAQGLREDSLHAPLRAHNQGRSRKGVHGVAEDCEPKHSEPILSIGAGKSLTDLLQEVLSSMHNEGDDEEAEELKRLAACVGLDGSLTSAVEPPRKRPCRQSPGAVLSGDSSTTSSSEDEDDLEKTPEEKRKIAAVLGQLCGTEDFPVTLEQQVQRLRKDGLWDFDADAYEVFVARHDEFNLIRCPGSQGPLVLPRLERMAGSSRWCHGAKYVNWCHEHRLCATGKSKKKWKHLESVVDRACRGGPCVEAVATEFEPHLVVQPERAPSVSHSWQTTKSPGDDDVSLADVETLGWNEDAFECEKAH